MRAILTLAILAAILIVPTVICQQFSGTSLTAEEKAMDSFRSMATEATKLGFIGAFPNFYEAVHGLDHVGGTILIKQGEWRDVPLSDLGNPSLVNFGDRMRATNTYASQNGFVGGFPNFYHADYGNGIVCGTVLLNSDQAEWRDVPLSELGNPSLDDIGARFRATQDYANKNGFVGGFPNFFQADYGNGIVCGTVLLKQNAAEWRDVILFSDPR
jgi:hypothetical protein